MPDGDAILNDGNNAGGDARFCLQPTSVVIREFPRENGTHGRFEKLRVEIGFKSALNGRNEIFESKFFYSIDTARMMAHFRYQFRNSLA